MDALHTASFFKATDYWVFGVRHLRLSADLASRHWLSFNVFDAHWL